MQDTSNITKHLEYIYTDPPNATARDVELLAVQVADLRAAHNDLVRTGDRATVSGTGLMIVSFAVVVLYAYFINRKVSKQVKRLHARLNHLQNKLARRRGYDVA